MSKKRAYKKDRYDILLNKPGKKLTIQASSEIPGDVENILQDKTFFHYMREILPQPMVTTREPGFSCEKLQSKKDRYDILLNKPGRIVIIQDPPEILRNKNKYAEGGIYGYAGATGATGMYGFAGVTGMYGYVGVTGMYHGFAGVTGIG
jgi:hypothetical protein